MRNKVQLITYVDRLGRNLPGLTALLKNEFDGLFGGVHLLPFFYPIDGADAGFDPADHATVDARLGNWNDVKALSQHVAVMADLIVNHVSSESPQFQDVVENGEQSPYWDLFLKRSDVFPNDTDAAALEKIFRPRPGPPFTTKLLANDKEYPFWTTFSDRQLDINVESEAGQEHLHNILNVFHGGGVSMIRLDAAGYAIKRAGTSCFMLPETFAFIEQLSIAATALDMEVLVEIHAHYQTQIQIAEKVARVYDFALPPLVLHSLFTGNSRALKNWLEISPRNCITVLDTHDGIGIIDAAKDDHIPGLLSDSEIDHLVEEIHRRSNGDSRKASGYSASNVDIYQVNCTYFDALGRSEKSYLLARAIQLFAPGIPQIYYVGLLAEGNDMELLGTTGVGRDINRHYFSADEISEALTKPVVKSLLALIRLRNSATGFNGDFSLPMCADDALHLVWHNGGDSIQLEIDFSSLQGTITQREKGVETHYRIGATFEIKPPT